MHPGDEIKFVRDDDGFVLALVEGALVFVKYEEGATSVFIATENVSHKNYYLVLNVSTFTALGLVKKSVATAPSAKKRGARRQMSITIVNGTDAAVGETVSLRLDTFETVAWRAVVTKKLRKPFPAAAGAGAADDEDDDDEYDADDDDDDDFDVRDDEFEGVIPESEVRDLVADADAVV